MKEFLTHPTRRNGLLAALGLVLAGSIVVGDENKRREEQVAPQKRLEQQTKVVPPPEELDLSPLHRARRDALITDPFAPRIRRGDPVPPLAPSSAGDSAPSAEASPPAAPAEPPAPPEPPAPTAPPLPFRYFGKIVNGGNTSVYVVSGDKDHAVVPGATIDGAYRIDELSDTAIVFTYLPLKLQQTLSIAEGPEK